MSKYVIFFISSNAVKSYEASADEEIKEGPLYAEVVHEFLGWMSSEMKAERIKSADFLHDASEETNVRVDFHQKITEEELEKHDGKAYIPAPNASVTREYQKLTSANIMGYYTAEFPTIDDVITWAKSCPISYDGYALEIRQLQDSEKEIIHAPAELREWTGDIIVQKRKQLLEQGKMKRDEDGTLWVKVEDEEAVKDLVAEAEERDT